MPFTIDHQAVTLRDLMRVHPLWLSRRQDWLVIEALRTKRIDFRRFLPRGPIEDEADYQCRLALTKFVPESTAARTRAVGAVFDSKPDRDQVEKKIREWAKSADRNGRSFAHWLEVRAAPIMFDFGACLTLIDRPRIPPGAPLPESAADEDAMGLTRPFLVAYTPLCARNWSVDDRGRLEWILFVEDGWASDGPMGRRMPARHYRLFDQEKWHVWSTRPVDADAKALQQTDWSPDGEPDDRSLKSEVLIPGSDAEGQHGSPGTVPVAVLMAEPDVDVVGRSLIEASVELDLRRMQLESDQTWDLWLHAHPLLYLKSRSEPSEIGLGTSKFVHLNPEDQEEIGYVVPGSESFQARERAIAETKTDTYRHTGVDPLGVLMATPSEASGVSRAWSYKTSEGRHVTRLRDRMEEGENRIYQIVAQFLGVPMAEPNPASWPDEYDAETRAESLTNAETARGLLKLSPTATRLLLKRTATRALGDLTLEQRQQIEAEIDAVPDDELNPRFEPPQGLLDFQQAGA